MSTVSDSIVIQMIADNKKFMADMDKMWSKVDKKVDSALKGQEKTVDKSTKKMANSYKDMISVAATAFSAVYLKKFIESSISAASSLENMEARFKALYKEGNQAAEMFDAVVSHATQVPHTLQQVGEAGARLSAFGLDMKKWLPVVSDLASFMGEDVVFAASSLGRAFQSIGAADVFRERGILDLIADFKGLSSRADLAKLSIHEYRKAIHDALTDRGGKVFGSAIAQATTFSGQLSMLSDAFATFSKGAWDAGLGDLLKSWVGIMKDLTTEAAAFWREWAKNSEAAKKQKVAEREKEWLDALQLDKNQLDPAMKNMIQKVEEYQDMANKLQRLIDTGLTGKVKETRHGPVYEKSSFGQQEIQLQELKVLEKNIKKIVDKIAMYRDKLSIKPPKAVRLERSEEMRNEIQSSLALLSKEKDSLYAVKIAREKNAEAIKLLESQIKTFSDAKHVDDIATRTALKEALTLRKAETVELEKQYKETIKKNKEAAVLARRQRKDFTPQEREKQQRYIDEAFRISTLEVEIKPKEDPLVKAISEAWQQAGDDIGKTIAEAVTSGFDSGLGGVTAGIKKILTAPAEAMISGFFSKEITGRLAYAMSGIVSPSSPTPLFGANGTFVSDTDKGQVGVTGAGTAAGASAGASFGGPAGAAVGVAAAIATEKLVGFLGGKFEDWFGDKGPSDDMLILRSATAKFDASVQSFSDAVLAANLSKKAVDLFDDNKVYAAFETAVRAGQQEAKGTASRDLYRELRGDPVTALEKLGRASDGLTEQLDGYRKNIDELEATDIPAIISATLTSVRSMQQIEADRLLNLKQTFDAISKSNETMLDGYIDAAKTPVQRFNEAANTYKTAIEDLKRAKDSGDVDAISRASQAIVDSQSDMLKEVSDKKQAGMLAQAFKDEYAKLVPEALDSVQIELDKITKVKDASLQAIDDIFDKLYQRIGEHPGQTWGLGPNGFGWVDSNWQSVGLGENAGDFGWDPRVPSTTNLRLAEGMRSAQDVSPGVLNNRAERYVGDRTSSANITNTNTFEVKIQAVEGMDVNALANTTVSKIKIAVRNAGGGIPGVGKVLG